MKPLYYGRNEVDSQMKVDIKKDGEQQAFCSSADVEDGSRGRRLIDRRSRSSLRETETVRRARRGGQAGSCIMSARTAANAWVSGLEESTMIGSEAGQN